MVSTAAFIWLALIIVRALGGLASLASVMVDQTVPVHAIAQGLLAAYPLVAGCIGRFSVLFRRLARRGIHNWAHFGQDS
ncbi:hypothetical protein [Rathayibacter rathayi]|uniref:hypothetical protein n=1 Tax=Rathayibacter rathayi TaxID=33887 RepID=UPI000CE8EE42|nr:hypothetical protein [Rathayibacter rathayi]PPH34155.1 hypothetical protein C5C28_10115 [Rathayibacter rathayi]